MVYLADPFNCPVQTMMRTILMSFDKSFWAKACTRSLGSSRANKSPHSAIKWWFPTKKYIPSTTCQQKVLCLHTSKKASLRSESHKCHLPFRSRRGGSIIICFVSTITSWRHKIGVRNLVISMVLKIWSKKSISASPSLMPAKSCYNLRDWNLGTW